MDDIGRDESDEETQLLEIETLVVDYVTLIDPKPYDLSSYEEIQKLTENLKFISEDLQVPIITAVQKPKFTILKNRWGFTMLDKLKADIITAMKAKDTNTLTTLRGLKAEAGNIAMTKKRKDVTEEDVLNAVTKGIKQRQESIDLYTEGGRDDLAKIEIFEKAILENYLPQQMSEDEILIIVDEAISTTGATTKKEMGKVMGMVMKKIPKGTADNKLVSKLIGSKLV